jgi:enoyl-CoA hydratase
MDTTEIVVERRGRVGCITLNRPERLNALTNTLIARLAETVEALGADPEVRVLLIRGAGRAFCAGYDLDWGTEFESKLEQESSWDPVRDYLGMSRNVAAFMALWRSPKPVVAAVHGWCVGGGTDLALCSDLIVVAEDAQIGYPPARVWGSPTTALWAYRIGLERAKRLLLTGDPVDGRTAERIGLASAAVPAERVFDEAVALAERMALVPANQLAMMKLLVNQTVENMGLATTQMLGTLFDGIARHTPEGVAWRERAREAGVRQALAERDGPFGDYGSRRGR